MKKTFSACLLATSLLTVSQLTIASDIDPIQLCTSLLEVQSLALTSVNPAQGKDRYNVSTAYQFKEDKTPLHKYKYSSYTFHVQGVKATDAANAIEKVTKALSNAVAQQATAIRVEPSSYGFNCVYPLDFSQFGDEYNSVYPVAIVEINSTDTQNLSAIPENLNP